MQPIEKSVADKQAKGEQPSMIDQLQDVLNLKELPDTLSIVMYVAITSSPPFVV